MADQFDDPGVQARHDALQRELRQLAGSLRAEIKEQGERTARQAAREVRRAGPAARQEARQRPPATSIAEQGPQQQQQAVRAANDVAAAEQRARLAAAERARETERAAAAERRAAEQQQAREQRERRALPRAGATTGGYFGGLTGPEVQARAEQRNLQTGIAQQQARARQQVFQQQQREARVRGTNIDAAGERLRRLSATRDFARFQQTIRGLGGDIEDLNRLRRELRELPAVYVPPGAAPYRERVREQEQEQQPRSLTQLVTSRVGPPPTTGTVSLSGQQVAMEQLQRNLSLSDRDFALFREGMNSSATTSQDFERQLQALARQHGLAANEMRRHGLLTTEFIDAAKQGRVTVSELGTQIGGTVAKFAGWTAAASLTYGAVAALQQVGTGAIESAQGVVSLQRLTENLNADRAKESFRELSREMNLPIEQVSAASFEAARVFTSQADIQAATRASLLGARVAELDPAEASRFATAISRGFQLGADRLEGVVDVANQVSNEMGARAAGILQGTAQAAGAINSAGGSVENLMAAVATIMLATGRTGTEAATALRRSAEIVQRPDRRAEIIGAFGIDPAAAGFDYFQLIQRGQELAQQPGVDVAELARIIGTPELAAGRLIPLLQRGEVFRAAQAQVGQAPGSAQRELDVILRSPREEMAEFANNLQQLGSALEQAGVFRGVGFLFRGLNELTAATTDATTALAQVPGPVQTAVGALAALVGGVTLARRFDFGGLFGGPLANPRLLGRRTQSRQRAEVMQGLQDDIAYTSEEARRATRRRTDLFRRQQRVAEVRDQIQADIARTTAAGGEISGDQADALAQAQRGVNRAARQSADAAEESEMLARRHAELMRQENEFRRRTTRRGGESVKAAADSLGIYYGSSIEPRPRPVGLIDLSRQAYTQQRAVQQGAAQWWIGGGRQGPMTARQFRGAEELQAERADRLASRSIGQRASDFGTAGFAGVTAGFAAARSRASDGLKSSRNLIREIGQSIGALERVGLQIIGGYTAIQTVNEAADQMASRLRAIQSSTDTGELEDLGSQFSGAERIVDFFERPLREINSSAVMNALLPERFEIDRTTTIDTARRAAEARRAELEGLRSRAQRTGVGLTRGEIRQRLQENLARGMDPNEAAEIMQEELRVGFGQLTAAGPRELDRARRDARIAAEEMRVNLIDAARAVAGDFADGLSMEALALAVDARRLLGRGEAGTRRGVRRTVGRRYRELAVSTDTATQLEAAQEIDAQTQRDEEALERRRQLQLARDGSFGNRRRVNAQFIRARRVGRLEPIREQIRFRNEAQANLQRQLDAEESRLGNLGAGGGAGGATRIRARMEQLRAQIADSKRAERNLRGVLRYKREELRLLDQQLAQEEFQEREGRLEARAGRRAAGATNPAAAAQITLANARRHVQAVREAVRRGIASATDLENALMAELQAMQATAQAEIGRRASQRELATAQFAVQLGTGPGAEGALIRRGIQDAQARAEDIRSNLGRLGADGEQMYNDALTQVYNQQRALAEWAEQERERRVADQEALLSAQERLALSRQENPAAQALTRVRFARRMLRLADTPVERLDRQAALNEARRNRRSAVYSEQLEQINFDADIGRIDRDVQIQRLNSLLATIRGNRELRRQIRRQIKQLEEEGNQAGELNLDIGNIKLPSLYEVRRMTQAGMPTRSQSVVDNRQFNVTITTPEAAEAFGAVLERTNGTSARATARTIGMR